MNALHNTNIERAVLNSILFNPPLIDQASKVLGKDDFYLPFHREVYGVMLDCEMQNSAIDEEIIKERLMERRAFVEDSMLEILTANPLSYIAEYCEELKEKATKRRLLLLSTSITQNVEKFVCSKDVLDSVQKELFEMATGRGGKEFSSGEELAEATLAHMKLMGERAKDGITGLTSGFKSIDNYTGGFGDSDLVILAARPAMGKTSLALNMVDAALKEGKAVAFFSLEMPKEQLYLRLLAAKTSIALKKLKTNDLSEEEHRRVQDAIAYFTRAGLYINDDGQMDIHLIRGQMRKLKAKDPRVGLCVVDYLQLMTSVASRERHLEISEISRGLKLLAREIGTPVLALSQLNRGVEARTDKRPMLSDLRESGAIEQDADMVLFVYREDVYKQQEARAQSEQNKKTGMGGETKYIEKEVEPAEIIIGKNRNGPVGVAHLSFVKAKTQFVKSDYYSMQNGQSAEVEIVYDEKVGGGFEMPAI